MMFARKPRVAVVRATGVITSQARGRNKLSMAKLDKPLAKAFKMRNVRAVALVVNSPGGSPAQSNLIMKRVQQLRKQHHNVPVYTFVEDLAASGGYYIACAGDKIFADDNSIVGSIGVVSGGFGLDKWIKRYDIDRRMWTAGKKKVFMDPFQPEDKNQTADLQHLLDGLHQNFKDAVTNARGKRLDLNAKDLFEGQVWLAKEAAEIGLIDGIGDMHSVMKDLLGEEPNFVEVNKTPGFMDMMAGDMSVKGMIAAVMGRGESVDMAAASQDAVSGAIAAVEADAAWRSFGVVHRE